MEKNFATVIMAAGKGTRMKNSEKAKVMFEVAGKPMIQHVVDLAVALNSTRIIAVVGYYRESVITYVHRTSPSVEFAVQEPQLGTGHAVMQAKNLLRDFRGDVLVLSGDVPLLREQTIRELISVHRKKNAVATILTAELEDPSGYGRVLRGEGDNVVGIVEHKDATDDQRRVREINSGIYIFDNGHLFDALGHITAHNAQKEYYLTDVFGYYWEHGMKVAAKKAVDFNEVRGVNTVGQLEEANEVLQKRNPVRIPVV
jgi:UDP-N-acetylglucosamine pyrophosphorylase